MKKMISMLLVVALLAGVFPIGAQAQELAQPEKSRQLGMSQIGSQGYVTMTTSQKMLDLLKVTEGYTQKAYSDNTQYSIGYGTKANSPTEKLPDGQKGYEEAEKRLKVDIAERERLLNNYCRNTLRLQPNQHQFDALVSFTYNNGSGWFFGSRLADWLRNPTTEINYCRNTLRLQPNQHQFDALVSFTYNNGSGWFFGSRLADWLRNPTTEINFLNAFGQWCHVGTTPWYGLAQRRIREALVFLRGEYYLPGKPTQEHLIKTEEFLKDPGRFIRVNGNLPYFASVIMDEGKDASISDRIEYRQIGGTLGTLPTPKAEGKEFLGWQITMEDNSDVTPRPASSSTVVEQNLYLKAKWDGQSPVDPELPKPPVQGLPFNDVSTGAWYYNNVKFVYDNGYMAGTATDRFSPEESVTRAMFVTMLYRVAGSPEVTQEQKEHFTDTQNQYYTDAAGWAWANGIVSGVGEGRFAPNERIIRQDAELMFYHFTDTQNQYYTDAAGWAWANGIVSGVGEGRFAPNERIIRQDAELMFYKLCVEYFQYYTDAAGWAWANGIVSGVGEGRFAPNERIIRQDAELMFYKLCVEYFGISAGEPADLSVFVDLGQLSSYAKEAVAWAVAVEMMAGEQRADGLYMCPRDNLTRAQAATLITRFVKDIIG